MERRYWVNKSTGLAWNLIRIRHSFVLELAVPSSLVIDGFCDLGVFLVMTTISNTS